MSFLECDVGQSEFTVSGVVALHCLSEPIFGPSFVHLQNPEKLVYCTQITDLFFFVVELLFLVTHHLNSNQIFI